MHLLSIKYTAFDWVSHKQGQSVHKTATEREKTLTQKHRYIHIETEKNANKKTKGQTEKQTHIQKIKKINIRRQKYIQKW